MEWDYKAESAKALSGIRHQLLKGPTQKALDEQLQLTRLLESLAQHAILKYPVRVKHTHSARPDFQLLVGEQRISLEASKIASPNYGHAASLQHQGLHAVLMDSEFLRPGQPRLPRKEVIQKGFIIPQMVYPPSAQEIDAAWWEHFQRVVEGKLKKLSEDDFQHGDEDWLVLWDRLGTDDWQMEDRLPKVRAWLAPIWNRRHGFSRIFIQEQDFAWIAGLSRGHGGFLTRLPSS